MNSGSKKIMTPWSTVMVHGPMHHFIKHTCKSCGKLPCYVQVTCNTKCLLKTTRLPYAGLISLTFSAFISICNIADGEGLRALPSYLTSLISQLRICRLSMRRKMSQVIGPCSNLHRYSRGMAGYSALRDSATIGNPIKRFAHQFTLLSGNALWVMSDRCPSSEEVKMRWENLLDHALLQGPHRNVMLAFCV